MNRWGGGGGREVRRREACLKLSNNYQPLFISSEEHSIRVSVYTVGSEVGQSCSFTLLVVTTLIDLSSVVYATSRSVWSTGS